VSANTFGLLFTQAVDANFFAQPLYVHGLTIHNKSHNVVFVATMHDTVYAFDADTPQAALWSISLGAPVTISPGVRVGIMSTPVIDTASKTLFVVALANEAGASVFRLHALNLLTGAELANVIVQGAVAGTGDDSQTTTCTSGNGGPVQPPCIPLAPPRTAA
jgi:outer membrane protein assembly factor BamB